MKGQFLVLSDPVGSFNRPLWVYDSFVYRAKISWRSLILKSKSRNFWCLFILREELTLSLKLNLYELFGSSWSSSLDSFFSTLLVLETVKSVVFRQQLELVFHFQLRCVAYKLEQKVLVSKLLGTIFFSSMAFMVSRDNWASYLKFWKINISLHKNSKARKKINKYSFLGSDFFEKPVFRC